LRIAGGWLLVLCMVAGSAGPDASWAFADGSKPCGAACPCDQAEHEEQGSTHAEHAESRHDADDPCEDQCPEDCPNCGCGLGVAAAVMNISVQSFTLGSRSMR